MTAPRYHETTGEGRSEALSAKASAATDDQSLSAKLWREARLIGGGLASGLADGVTDKIDNPLGTAGEVAASYYIGRALAYATHFGPLGKVATAGIGAGLLVTSLGRSDDFEFLKNAVGDAWTSERSVARNQQRVGSILGSTAVDLSLNSVAGAFGANQTIKNLAERQLLSEFSQAQNSLVRIYKEAPGQSSQWAGSGFAAADRSIVSAHHVVEGGYVGRETVPGTKFTARSHAGEEYPLSIAHENPTADVVVFRTEKPHGIPPLEISSQSEPLAGTPVVSLGAGGQVWRAKGGTVLGTTTDQESFTFYNQSTNRLQRFADTVYDHTFDRLVKLMEGEPKEVFAPGSRVLVAKARVHAGMSGGPLISKIDGRVLGANSWSQDGLTNFSGFVPAPAIRDALAAAEKSV